MASEGAPAATPHPRLYRMTPRFRFAPSPTGQLHVGGARTAILNWLLAQRLGGAFVLRIEDTDVVRNVDETEGPILEDLRWLGLDWDEGPDVGGAFGPYRQSERMEQHRTAALRLLREERAYLCSCPPAREGSERAPRCRCAERPGGEWREGSTLRFLVPDEEIVVHDRVRGDVVFPAGSVEDFVVLRGNGRATYNFAAAVDDLAMEITHVVRGADHLINTPKQVLVQRALGASPPEFAHIPLILGEDRQKLSKRHGATSVGEHRRQGYMPEALVNYLSLLSWSSPTGEEFLPVQRLIEEIELGRVGASDAVFDREKLRWLSSRYIQEMPVEELCARLAPFLRLERHGLTPEQLPAAAEVLRPRIAVLGEAEGRLDAFLGPIEGERAERRRDLFTSAESAALLEAVAERLEALAEWTEPEIDGAVRGAGRAVGARGKALFLPLRVALTGDDHGPELWRVIFLLGRDRATRRLRGDGTFDAQERYV